MKYWELKNKGRRKKYLVLSDQAVGHAYSQDDGYDVSSAIRQGTTPPATESIPFGYIRSINSSVSSTSITIHYKKESTLIYNFTSLEDKNSFYQAVKNLPQGYELKTEDQSIFSHLKIQIVAFLLLSVFFGWAFTSAAAIENGTHPGRDLAVILLVAELGTTAVALIALAVLAILSIRVYFKMRIKEAIETIQVRM